MCVCVKKGKNGYTKELAYVESVHSFGRVHLFWGSCIQDYFYHFSSCVEPLSLLEGLALFSGGFELFWSFC